MQKKKKVAKTKAKAVKATASKNAQTKPIVKKAAKKLAPKKVETKTEAVKPQPAPKAEKAKAVPAKEVAPVISSKIDFKNLSPEAQDQYKRWLKLQKQLAEEKTHDYRMTEDFELKTPIAHKVHGWGVVMQKRDNYIDVLFEAGLKTLIVNYKP